MVPAETTITKPYEKLSRPGKAGVLLADFWTSTFVQAWENLKWKHAHTAIAPQPSDKYPELAKLLHVWLNKSAGDKIFSEKGLKKHFARLKAQKRKDTAIDMRQFIEVHGASEASFSESFKAIFMHGTRVLEQSEVITRQWLEHVADFLEKYS